MLKTVGLLDIFRILWWIESSKEQRSFEIEIFCNIINSIDSDVPIRFDFDSQALDSILDFFDYIQWI